MEPLARPYAHAALRLPSGHHKVVEIKPNTYISLGKYGTFSSNDLLGRPYHHTYEILDKSTSTAPSLRLIQPAELHAHTISDDASTPSESREDGSPRISGAYGLPDAQPNNQLTMDDPNRQGLSMEEIEELKASGSGREVIAKIMSSHSHLSEKTAYSLAKYALRKHKKYMKHFTLLPLDVDLLAYWYLHEKEAPKILELRQDSLGLIMSWANVQCGESCLPQQPTGRWLLVDDTAGLLTAAMAERMGILYMQEDGERPEGLDFGQTDCSVIPGEPSSNATPSLDSYPRQSTSCGPTTSDSPALAVNNTITLIHSATQPNLSLLSYFGYDPNNSADRPRTHPLDSHLKTVTWLQLLDPVSDVTYVEPAQIPTSDLHHMKSGKRGAYHRKRRRWAHCKAMVDDARAGDFDGLVVATSMELPSVLHHLVPLLRGGAPIVIYSPNAEPLAEITDAYSSSHKTAFLNALEEGSPLGVPTEDFPVDPRLILAPSLQTARAREWQVLPGRSHPVMTTRGGAEGYVFTGTRVSPAEGKVAARGNFMKKRKKEVNNSA